MHAPYCFLCLCRDLAVRTQQEESVLGLQVQLHVVASVLEEIRTCCQLFSFYALLDPVSLRVASRLRCTQEPLVRASGAISDLNKLEHPNITHRSLIAWTLAKVNF